MKFIPCLVFLLFALISSCSASRLDSVGPEYRTMYAVIIRATKQIQKKYDVTLIGHGGASDIDNKTTTFNADFQINRPLSLEEVRALIVDIADVFLSVINNDKAHRPYLRHYPFDVKGLDITIYILNNDSSTVFHPNLCVAHLYEEKIKYCTKDSDKEYGYKSRIWESYEEAVEKVKRKN